MSLILQSTAMPAQSRSGPLNATALRDDGGQSGLSSFCEVLFRSLTPSAETPGKVATKAAGSMVARRQTVDDKTDPADLVNGLALPIPVHGAPLPAMLATGPSDSPNIAPQSKPIVFTGDAVQTALPPPSVQSVTTLGNDLSSTSALAGLAGLTTAQTVVGRGTAALSASNSAALQRRTAVQDMFNSNQGNPAAVMSAMTRLGISAAELATAMDYKLNTDDWLRQNGAADGFAGLKVFSTAEVNNFIAYQNTGSDVYQIGQNSDSNLHTSAANARDFALAQQTMERDLRRMSLGIGYVPAYLGDWKTGLAQQTTTTSVGPAQSQNSGAAQVLADQPAVAVGIGLAAADTPAQTVLGSAPAATIQENATRALLQAMGSVASDPPALATDPAKAVALIIASDTGTSGKLSIDVPANHDATPAGLSLPKLLEPGMSSGPTQLATKSNEVVAATYASPNNTAGLAQSAPRTDLSASDKPALAPAPGATPAQTMPADHGIMPVQSTAPDQGAPKVDAANTDAAFLANPASPAASNPTTVSGSNNAGAAPTQATLAPEVGSKGWNQALGQQVLHMGTSGHQVTELQLNPPGLGPLKVTLDMNDHQMQLVFVSDHASVRAAVQAAVPQLRATLADNGISLGNTSVNSGSQAQTAFAQGQSGAPDHREYASNRLPDTAVPGAPALRGARRQSEGIGVDTYA